MKATGVLFYEPLSAGAMDAVIRVVHQLPPGSLSPQSLRTQTAWGSSTKSVSVHVLVAQSWSSATNPDAQGLGVDPQPLRQRVANILRPTRVGLRALRHQPDRTPPRSSGYFPSAGTVTHPSAGLRSSVAPGTIPPGGESQ